RALVRNRGRAVAVESTVAAARAGQIGLAGVDDEVGLDALAQRIPAVVAADATDQQAHGVAVAAAGWCRAAHLQPVAVLHPTRHGPVAEADAQLTAQYQRRDVGA